MLPSRRSASRQSAIRRGRHRAWPSRLLAPLLPLAVAATLVALSPRGAGAQCLPGGISTHPPPTASFLRSYRAGTVSPTRLAIDARDNLYVTDPESGAVLVRAANGRVTGRLAHAGRPVSVAVDAAGRVYVGDAHSGAITVYDADWTPLYQLGRGPGETLMPGDIAVDPDTGRIYVADSGQHVVKVYAPGGVHLQSIGGPGALEGELNFPAAIFLDPVTRVLLVADQLNFRLQAFDLDGGFLYCIGGAAGNPGSFFQGSRALHVPQGLWVDADGRIYVADASEGRVRVLDQDGVQIAHIGELGAAPGQLRIPMDVAIDGYGRLFVAASNNARLEIFGIDGFSDPETILPAQVALLPNPWNREVDGDRLTAIVTVPGYRIADVDIGSVAANGHAPADTDLGDADGDRIPELHARFDAAALTAGHPPGEPMTVTVAGVLGDMRFEGDALLVVAALTPADADGDGVGNEWDLCPDTAAGDPVDAAGCSVAQRCPCAGTAPDDTWKNHGRYVACVASASREILGAGTRLRAERIRTAARSDCGKDKGKGKGKGKHAAARDRARARLHGASTHHRRRGTGRHTSGRPGAWAP